MAEVRWVNLSEATELLPDMFGPVHDCLARTLPAPGHPAVEEYGQDTCAP